MAEQASLEEHSAPKRRPRTPTGVPNLDLVLGGGLPPGGLALILGAPGSGKTTLASQIAFAAARSGLTALLLTAWSEPTNKLLEHLAEFDFYDHALIGGTIQVLSLQQEMQQGLSGLGDAVRALVRQHKAGLVLLDGFRGIRSIERDPQGARELLYTLGTSLGVLGTTLLVTSETDPRDPTFFPETTTADVILGLHFRLDGVRQQRGLEVIKARGSAPLPGLHAFTLGREGASIYPQLEERVAAVLLGGDAQTQGAVGAPVAEQPALLVSEERVDLGAPELEVLLHGGLPRNTSTVLAGSLGIGKTILALHFAIAGARAGEPVVFLSLRESGEELRRAIEPFAIGTEWRSALGAQHLLTLLEVPPIKVNPDVIADRVLATLDATGAQRLVIDSIAELERALVRSGDEARLEEYVAALTRALHLRGVTSLLIKETPKVLAPILDFSSDRLAVLAENVLLLQQVPFQGAIHRILSVLKMRYSAHEAALREFRIVSPRGFEVLSPSESAGGVLAGITAWQDTQQQMSPRATGRAVGNPHPAEGGDT